MDPSIWGTKLWNIIFDICWMLERRGARLPQTSKDAVNGFFDSMTYLLPCIHCRKSYSEYLDDLKMPPHKTGALRWCYDLKNLVNKKLNKKDSPPTYDCFKRRMKTWTSASSPGDLWDILSVYAMNFDVISPDLSKKKKHISMMKLLSDLPKILIYLPNREKQVEIMKKHPPTTKDVLSSSTLLQYLCTLSNKFYFDSAGYSPRLSRILQPIDLSRKYSNCQSKKNSNNLKNSPHGSSKRKK